MLRILVLLGLLTTTAQAMPRCASYAEVVKILQRDYGERRVQAGVNRGQKSMTELWMKKDGSSWTLLMVGIDGNACLLIVGENWVKLGEKGEEL